MPSSPISRWSARCRFERCCSRCSTGSTRLGRSPFHRRNGFASSAFRPAANGSPRFALIAGDHEAAATYLRDACDALEAIGNLGQLSSYAAMLGGVLCKLGRDDEAEPFVKRGRELGEPDDIATEQLWRQTQALVHAARGEREEAEGLAREAVDLSRRSDSLLSQGNALSDLAQVLEAADRREEASAALREALACYERKEIIPLARRTREKLATLEQQSGTSRAGGVSPPLSPNAPAAGPELRLCRASDLD
jgi:tetratricopeptide (TPR) repeat protein